MGRGKRTRGQGVGAGAPRLATDFNPTVSFEKDTPGVTVWLPELGLYGHGDDFEAAKRDLVDEVREYARQYRDHPSLSQAPNRRDHGRLLDLFEEADAADRIDDVLFAEPALA